jgi:hypothetical protein
MLEDGNAMGDVGIRDDGSLLIVVLWDMILESSSVLRPLAVSRLFA